MSILETKNLGYSYNGKSKVLEDISISFDVGKMYAILGPSGCGKTTLLSLLGGLDVPTKGEVVCNGENINKLGLAKHRHENVSFIFQAYNLIDYMNSIENVKLTSKKAPLPILERLGLTKEETKRNVLKLSGGQQQRVAIARALASDTAILLADEPTGNLDEDTAEEITQILKESAHELKRCVIIVTHSGALAKQADIVIKLRKGKAQIFERPEEINKQSTSQPQNPVYCGKIAYGRRTREKVKGTKNEYKQVHTDDYILEDGQHEGIVSEELWQKVHAKRKATGIKQPSKVGKDRSHLLTGVLKCPLCGTSMYTNKHAWTNKDGTYKEVYYYICGRNKQERGHHCDYKASLRKTDIEPLIVEALKELVSDAYFAKEIEKRIGVQTDTSTVDKELANYENKLKEVDLNKARLENEIDNLPADARYRERKIHDMTLRLDALYDMMVELEERIEDAKLRKSSIEMEAITLDNVYKIMQNFGKLYAIMSDEEKKSLITYLIKEIQIYPNGESEMPLKSIEFNFPIYIDGKEVRKVLWERGNTVDTGKGLQKILFAEIGYGNVGIIAASQQAAH